MPIPLTDSETTIFHRLSGGLGACARNFSRLDAYYEGEQHLEQLGLAVPPELKNFVTIVNWPRTVTDSVERRLDVEGFRLAGSPDMDRELWRIWQANDLDEESQLGHLDALIFGRSYVCVGTNPDDDATPLVTIESPQEMFCEFDPKTHQVTAAVRRYCEPATYLTLQRDYATLYLPNQTIWLEQAKGQWVVEDRDVHKLGKVPVVPMVNRSRTKRRHGVSEMADVISLTDSAARALTNAQVATEVLAIPQRYAAGMTEADFQDPKTGEVQTAWEAYFGAVWVTANEAAKFGQFTAADLGNFTRIVDHYATQVAGQAGLPMRYFGQNTANPASAQSIDSDERRLIQNIKRKHRTFGGSWERTMRIVGRLVDGAWNPDLQRLETKWARADDPSPAQQADAVQKLSTTLVDGKPILPLRMAREQLGWSEEDIRRAEELDKLSPGDPVSQLTAHLEAQAAGLPTTSGKAVSAA